MDDKIKDVVKKLRTISLARQHLEGIRIELVQQQKRLVEIEQELASRHDKIEQLNQRNIYSVLKELMGQKTQLLDLHKQHYLNLVLEFNELHLSISKLDYESDVLERKISKQQPLIEDLKDMLKARDALLSNPELRELQEVTRQIDHKLVLIREIEEALTEGKRLNRLFNNALRFIRTHTGHLYKMTRSTDFLSQYDAQVIDKYQMHMVKIQHCMIKFEAEVNDVYNSIMTFKKEGQSISAHFLSEYRMNLINDIHKYIDLGNSEAFLKYHKSVAQNFTRTLRHDLKQSRQELLALEARESEIVDAL